MVRLGVEIMPVMPLRELCDTVRAAEDLGYDYCLIADEGLMHDVYVALAASALQTASIRLGPVTNGYTRHPAATAAALASLDELSGGRAILMLVAGGSMTLEPLGIPRQAPLAVVAETIEIARRMWSGERVSWEGSRFRLAGAELAMGRHDIPIWAAARGNRMLDLAGRSADGVVLMAQADLGSALEIVERGSAGRAVKPERIYLDRIAYTPEMLEEATTLYGYTILDSPPRLLRNLGLSDAEISEIRQTIAIEGAEAALRLVSPDMIRRYQIAGTPQECRRLVGEVIRAHHIDTFLLDIVSGGLAANVRLMEDTRDIVLAVAGAAK